MSVLLLRRMSSEAAQSGGPEMSVLAPLLELSGHQPRSGL